MAAVRDEGVGTLRLRSGEEHDDCQYRLTRLEDQGPPRGVKDYVALTPVDRELSHRLAEDASDAAGMVFGFGDGFEHELVFLDSDPVAGTIDARFVELLDR